MQGVVCVEHPFYKFIDFGASASFSVVGCQKENCQHHRQLNKSVYPVKRKEINCGVNRSVEDHPKHLGLEIIPVCAECQNTHKARCVQKRDEKTSSPSALIITYLNISSISATV